MVSLRAAGGEGQPCPAWSTTVASALIRIVSIEVAMLHYAFLGFFLGCTGIGLLAFIGSGNPLWFVGPLGAFLYLFRTRPRH